METHTGSCPWQSYTEPQQTKAFQLGGLRCPPRPNNMFSEQDSKGVREYESLKPTLLLIGHYIKALSHR